MLSRIITKTTPLQAMRAFSTWGALDMAPKDPILGINEAFKADKREGKQLLGVGAYRTNEGKPYILDCVKKAELKIFEQNIDHEYSPIEGNAGF